MLGAEGPLLGTAYYPEYQPGGVRADAVARDLDLMVVAGIRLIRVGESVWSTWEPRDGEFDLEWITPVLDAAHERGMRVILGTPTYAVPPWLQRAHPELAVELADGRTARWGARQEVDFTDPVFRGYAERIVRRILEPHGRHPAIAAIQLDNEPGLHLIHNAGVVARFRDWLRARFGSVEELNEAWGLTYWSHRIAEWDELWAPGGNTTPAYDLAWRRFQAEQTTEFIAWQAAIAREYVDASTELTTCIAYNRPAIDDVALGGALDVVSGNAYLRMQDSLAHTAVAEHGASVWFSTSPAGLFQQADRMRSSREAPFLVTETGATSIAGSSMNLPPFDGQLAQVALALIARGARLVSYWHWHTLHSGAEAYWGGILGHDLEPGRSYRAIADLGRQLDTAGVELAGLEPDADIGFLYSRESRWAMQFHPPLADRGGSPDRASFDRILGRFVEAAIDAGRQCGFVSTEQLPSAWDLLGRYPVFVVAGAVALDDAAAAVLTEYAALGGRLIVGIRSGYGDERGRARAETAPGPLREAAGVRYREYSNLATPIALAGARPGATAEAWVDHLELEGATLVAGYGDERWAAWPAITQHAWGAGAVVYVGTLPDRATVAGLLGASTRRTAPDFPELPDSVTVHTARSATGGELAFVHNWSSGAATLETTMRYRDVLRPDAGVVAEQVDLAPWGVRVLKKETS